MDSLVEMVTVVHQDKLVHLDNPVSLVKMGNLVLLVSLVHLVNRVSKGFLVNLVCLDSQDSLDYLAKQGSKERQATKEHLEPPEEMVKMVHLVNGEK